MGCSSYHLRLTAILETTSTFYRMLIYKLFSTPFSKPFTLSSTKYPQLLQILAVYWTSFKRLELLPVQPLPCLVKLHINRSSTTSISTRYAYEKLPTAVLFPRLSSLYISGDNPPKLTSADDSESNFFMVSQAPLREFHVSIVILLKCNF